MAYPPNVGWRSIDKRQFNFSEALVNLPSFLRRVSLIWDAGFLYGPHTASGKDTDVLCEINVSSVFPIPEQTPAAIVCLARQRLQRVI
jgi:hypothetical protein